jgi:alcohol dehydrogenase class IV
VPSRSPEFSYHNPVAVRFGRGCARSAFDGLPRPILCVAGKATLERSGLSEHLDAGQGVHDFSEVPVNPGAEVIDEGAAVAARLGMRSIVGVGGGSPLDAAKCIAVLCGNMSDIGAFQKCCDAGRRFERNVRLVMVPTTAGTGSEVTRWASLWDEEGRKTSMDCTAGYADTAFVDPALTDSMGPRLTAATGLDSMAHAMESIWGVHANPVSDSLAVRSLELIGLHLRNAISAPGTTARDGMAEAALLAGLALSNCRSAAAHALSYGLTGRFGLDHGLAVGLLCRAILPLNARFSPKRVALIVDALGADTIAGVECFIDSAFHAAGLDPSLKSFGIGSEAHLGLAQLAGTTDRLANNPGRLCERDLVEALERIA